MITNPVNAEKGLLPTLFMFLWTRCILPVMSILFMLFVLSINLQYVLSFNAAVIDKKNHEILVLSHRHTNKFIYYRLSYILT